MRSARRKVRSLVQTYQNVTQGNKQSAPKGPPSTGQPWLRQNNHHNQWKQQQQQRGHGGQRQSFRAKLAALFSEFDGEHVEGQGQTAPTTAESIESVDLSKYDHSKLSLMADELNKRIVEAAGYSDVTQHRESVQAARMCRAVPASDDDKPPSDADDDAVSFVSCDDLDNRASFCSLNDFEWEEERSATIREVGEKAFAVQVGKQVVASGEMVAELDFQCTFLIFPRSKVCVIREWPCISWYVEVFKHRSEAVTTSKSLCCLQYLSPGGEGTVSVVQIGNITDSPEADLLIHAGVVDRFDETAVVRGTGRKFVRVGLQREFDP